MSNSLFSSLPGADNRRQPRVRLCLESEDAPDDDRHDLTLGWRLLSAPGNLDTELDIKALRRRDGEGKTNHGIGAQWKLSW